MKSSFLPILKTGFIAGLVSGAVNAILFYIFKATGVFSDTIFLKPNEPLSISNIVFASVFPSLVGSILLYFLMNYSQRGFRTFTIISVIVLLLSLVNPFVGIEGVTMAYAAALDVMHFTVVSSLLYFQNRLVNRSEQGIESF